MNRRGFNLLALLAAGGMWNPWTARAEQPEDEPDVGHFNAVMPTLGGRQFWADELFFHDWHIQRNSFTGHCRLLDGSNMRYAWGTFEECRTRLEQIKVERQLPPMRGSGVVVLHGLFRSAASMSEMSRYLQEQGGYSVFNLSYPTTRGTVADHAQTLAKVLAGLEGLDEIHLVAHSLGNLVVRHYVGDCGRIETGQQLDPRIKRMVMLGPPNQGAAMAEALADRRLFHFVAGASGSQLAREWQTLESRLATPSFEFGILAGGRGTATGFNPWLGEDNDMVVSVETTKLAGASDFAVLPVLHTLMMDDDKVQEYTLRFLQRGYFISADERQPLRPEHVRRRQVPVQEVSRTRFFGGASR